MSNWGTFDSLQRYIQRRSSAASRLSRLFIWMVVVGLISVGVATSAHAEPDSPAVGGVFTVTVSSNNNHDGEGLSLREALLLARGGTGAGGLNRGLSSVEVGSISGCDLAATADGKWHVLNGCGANKTDTILFASWVAVIDMGNLPFIDDSAPTIIDGGGTTILDRANDGLPFGITLNSHNNVLKNLTIRRFKCSNSNYCEHGYALGVFGSNNLVANITIQDIQSDALAVGGNGNIVDNVRIGVVDGAAICPDALPGIGGSITGHGIYVGPNATNLTIKNSIIGCNGKGNQGAGIYVNNATGSVTIGPNNKIGTLGNGATAMLGNAGSGIVLNEAQHVTIISNTIGYNGAAGVLLVNSSSNNVSGNLIRNNGGDGVALMAASNENLIGVGNRIGYNGSHGIALVPIPLSPMVTPTGNRLVGNWIGTLNVVDAAPNQGSGIVLTGAVDTAIGDPAPAAPNVIGGNEGHGIWLRSAAHDTTIYNNYIGTNGFTALPNGKTGILVEGDAHHNRIGMVANSTINHIRYNGEAGVRLRDAGTSFNIFLNNVIANNQLDGVQLENQAENNSIGGTGLAALAVNRIYGNGGSGVRINGGAHHNSVGGNHIYSNNGAGVHLLDAQTYHNIVIGARLYENGGGSGDGIAQSGGAGQNSWSRISTFANAGLGIDLAAANGANTITGSYPIITAITIEGDTLIVSGNGAPSNFGEKITTVEIYRVAEDPSGHGEGQSFVVSGQTNANGDFSFAFAGATGCFTAFQTISEGDAKSSSEFGPNFCKGTPQTITFDEIPNKFVGDPAFAVNPTASSGLAVTLQAEGACTLTQQTVHLTGAGSCVLTAKQSGNTIFAPAPDKSVQFEILKKTQSIQWGVDGASQNQFVDAAPFLLNAAATSGLPVSFEAQGVCTVSGATVTLTGEVGACTVSAQQPGNAEFSPAAQAEKSFEVAKHNQTITFAAVADQVFGDPPFEVAATATSSLPVTLVSLTQSVCTVANSTVTLVGTGACNLVASQSGNAVFNPAPLVARSFGVKAADTPGAVQTLYLPVVSR